MTRLWHIGLACVLACALILQGQSAAARVTMKDATGQIVICTGTGLMAVFVDADGQPVDNPEPCPDCMIVSILALIDADVQPAAPVTTLTLASLSGTLFQPDWLAQIPRARAPPPLV